MQFCIGNELNLVQEAAASNEWVAMLCDSLKILPVLLKYKQ